MQEGGFEMRPTGLLAFATFMLVFVASLASAQGFSGSWDTNMGQMALQQNGNRLTGTYSSSGTVEGTVTGNYVTGTYTNGAYEGQFEFTLTPDGNSFAGRWWRPGRDRPWTGTRIGGASQPPQVQPQPQPSGHASFVGSWDTNMGQMALQQNGNRLTGTYSSSGTVEGTVTGHYVTGTYTNGAYEGQFEFTLAPDGNSFTGRWWRSGRDRPWTGTRIGEATPASNQPSQTAPVGPSIEGLWQVEDATDGRNYNYWSTPWEFLPDGTVHSGEMWAGIWERRDNGSYWMQILSHGEVVDEYILVMNRDHRFFAARQDGIDQHYGDRM
jgi:hypothetical protein